MSRIGLREACAIPPLQLRAPRRFASGTLSAGPAWSTGAYWPCADALAAGTRDPRPAAVTTSAVRNRHAPTAPEFTRRLAGGDAQAASGRPARHRQQGPPLVTSLGEPLS